MQKAKTFMVNGQKLHLLFLTTVGSTLHKLNLDNSDVDLKGVFVWDKSALSGLSLPEDTLSWKKFKNNPEVWKVFLNDVQEFLQLDFALDDDFELFEARKFFLTALKNDFNMFDMLFSDLKPLFLADTFKPVLNNKKEFLNMEHACSRFVGMATGALVEAKKLNRKEELTDKQKNDLKKNMAKSLQFLFSLKNLLLEQTYSPVLKTEQLQEVLEVKKGNFVFKDVEKRHLELLEEVKKLKEQEELLQKVDNRNKVNELLVDLNMFFFNLNHKKENKRADNRLSF